MDSLVKKLIVLFLFPALLWGQQVKVNPTDGHSYAVTELEALTTVKAVQGDYRQRAFTVSEKTVLFSGPESTTLSDLIASGIVAQGFGPELYTTATAASDPNGNEADAITGINEFGLNGTGANVLESQGAVKDVGSFSVHADANDTPTSLWRIWWDLEAAPFNLIDGDEVKLSYRARHNGIAGASGVVKSFLATTIAGTTTELISLSVTDITFQTVDVEYTHSNDTRYLNFREFTSQNDGGIYFDNFSVRKK